MKQAFEIFIFLFSLCKRVEPLISMHQVHQAMPHNMLCGSWALTGFTCSLLFCLHSCELLGSLYTYRPGDIVVNRKFIYLCRSLLKMKAL